MINRNFPADFLPSIFNTGTYHGFSDAIFMRGITKSKSTFNARMTMIGFAVFIRHHANHLFAFHFCSKGTTNTAIGASRDDGMFGLTMINNRLFH